MKRTVQERCDTLVHLACEECGEETVFLVPQRRYGIVDCPGCRTAYLVSLVAADA